MYTHLIFPVTMMPPEVFYQRKQMLFEWVAQQMADYKEMTLKPTLEKKRQVVY
jgi:hypothetical protein